MSTPFTSSPIMKTLLSQNYETLSKSSSPFTDPFFPPDDQSLFSSKSSHVNYKVPSVPVFMQQDNKKFLSQYALSSKDKSYNWKRLSELYNLKDLNILNENDLTQDVIQGILGDCYFLSAALALSYNPKRIKNLFPKNKINDKGVYECNVYVHGQKIPICLDDYIPTIEENDEDKIAFAGLNEKSKNIWPILLEKVWAKCNNTYEDIIIGNSSEAFEFLSPAPFDTYYHNYENKNLYDLIVDSVQKGFIVVSDITDTEDSNIDYLSKMGLVTNHSYMIVDTVVLKNPNGTEVKLLQIKNPWGTNEWLGDWSDDSRKWNDDFKKQVNLENKENGVFWIAYEDFLQFYTCTHICQIHDNYEYNSQKFSVNKDEPFNLIKVNVHKESEGYFIINLKNKRIYKNLKGKDDFENPFCQMNVFRINKNEFTYIGSDSGEQDRLYVHCEKMISGDYYIAVTFPKDKNNCDLNDNFEGKDFEKFSFRLGLYTPDKNLKIEDSTPEEKNKIKDYIFNMLRQIAKSNNEKYRFTNEGENNTFRVISFNSDRNGFGYIFYENNSDAYLRERVKLTSLINVNIIPIMKSGQFAKDHTEKEDEEVEYEDISTKLAMDNLKELKLDSTYEIIEVNNKKEISEKNPITIQFNIAPHSSCLIFLQKTDEEADIDFESDISFDYLPNVFLAEQRFRSKKYKLRYNNKPVEIFECITEHNTGVFFHYKNRTSDFRVRVTANFIKLDNLYLQLNSNDLKTLKELKLRKNIEGKFKEDGDDQSVTVTIEPGQTGFFGLVASDAFAKFSYTCQFDYHFSLAKAPETFDDNNNDNVNGPMKDYVTEEN